MKKYLFISILLLAVFLRFYKLGIVPASLDWDEASLGYNAYTLLLTGADEYGNSWPLSIRSFNDYKPPAYTYLDILPTAIFGLNEFSTRFPAAFFGSLSVIGVYFLTKEFFLKSAGPRHTPSLPLLAMFVFAISPWHLQFSRAAFEGNIAVFFVIWGMYFLLRWISTSNICLPFLSAVFLTGSMYSYHAARLIVPVLLLSILLRYRNFFIPRLSVLIFPVLLGILLCLPLVLVLARGSASERFSSVSIFNPSIEILRPLAYEAEDNQKKSLNAWVHNRRIEYIKAFIGGYINHFNPINLFLKGDIVPRHHAPDVGLFYRIEFLFIIIGIVILIRASFNYKYIFFFWAFIAPVPAAISTGTPHAIRSILFLPLPQIAVAVGILYLIKYIKENTRYSKYLLVVLLFIYSLNFLYYLTQYYVQMDFEYAKEWQYGYREVIKKISPLEKNYDKIIVTTAYDQPYIYFLYYKQYNPVIWKNPGDFSARFDKYEFRKIDWSKDRLLHNTLLIGEPIEIPENEPGTLAVIKYPGSKDDAFRIISSQL